MSAMTFTSPAAFVAYASKWGEGVGTQTSPRTFNEIAAAVTAKGGGPITFSFTPPVSSAFCNAFLNNPNA